MVDVGSAAVPDHTHSYPTPVGHYVYLHRRITDNKVFYVGKGKERRAWDKCSRNRKWRHVVKKHGRKVQIIKSALTNEESLALEIALIDFIGMESLTNLTEGGGGALGWKHSEEAKKKISAFNKGKKLTEAALNNLRIFNTNKVISVEQRLKMSIAKKGKPRKPLSQATKDKISASHMGMRSSKEAILKMRESRIGKYTGKNSPSYDHTIRHFFHEKHGSFFGTRGEFIIKYSLQKQSSSVSSVIMRKQQSVFGWRMA